MFIFKFGQRLVIPGSVGLNDIRRVLWSWIRADKITCKIEKWLTMLLGK